MKALLLTAFTLLSSQHAMASISCEASVSYSFMKDGKVVTQSQPLTTSPAPDRENTIVAARMLGQLLSVTFSLDESTIYDTSNYLNKFGDDSIAISSDTAIPWTNDVASITHKLSQASSNGQADTLDATFTMSCKRSL